MKNTSTKNDDKTRIMMQAAAQSMEMPEARGRSVRLDLPAICFVLGILVGLLVGAL